MIDRYANLQIGCLETKWRTGLKRRNSILIESLRENAKKINKAQTHWLRVWRSWTAQKGYDQNIKNYEPEALNKILEDFHAIVRKKDGKDYTSMTVFSLQLNVT